MTPKFVERLDLFSTPVWRYNFPDFENKQEELVRYLGQDQMWFKDQEMNGLQITEGNLHDKELHPALAPITDFFQACFEDVMDKMGYEKDVGITTIWSTRQKQGGHHFEHIHANTFLAGVLYMYDMDGNAKGTTFKNPNQGLYQIVPRVKKGGKEFFYNEAPMPFVPGTAVIFPGWALHATGVNDSRYRMMVGANCMPIGRTNTDHYHQYVFPDPEEFGYLPLNEDLKQR